MAHRKSPEELSVAELERLLYARKRAEREQRLRRAHAEGRVVIPDPDREDAGNEPDTALIASSLAARSRRPFWGWLADRGLLLVELAAGVALVVILASLWATNRQLNRELAQVQASQSQALALPTPTATPAIGVALLPGGHRPPIDGQAPNRARPAASPNTCCPSSTPMCRRPSPHRGRRRRAGWRYRLSTATTPSSRATTGSS